MFFASLSLLIICIAIIIVLQWSSSRCISKEIDMHSIQWTQWDMCTHNPSYTPAMHLLFIVFNFLSMGDSEIPLFAYRCRRRRHCCCFFCHLICVSVHPTSTTASYQIIIMKKYFSSAILLWSRRACKINYKCKYY